MNDESGASARLLEWVKYLPYGTPIGLPGGDADSDFDSDSADGAQIQAWISSIYDVRGDLDLDGDVDSTDSSMQQSEYDGTSLGVSTPSSSNVRNALAYSGAAYAGASRYFVRNRELDSIHGRWTRRDPLNYPGGWSLYEALLSQPYKYVDPYGLHIIWPIDPAPPGAGGGGLPGVNPADCPNAGGGNGGLGGDDWGLIITIDLRCVREAIDDYLDATQTFGDQAIECLDIAHSRLDDSMSECSSDLAACGMQQPPPSSCNVRYAACRGRALLAFEADVDGCRTNLLENMAAARNSFRLDVCSCITFVVPKNRN